MDFDRTFFDYSDPHAQSEPLWILRKIAKNILYFGLLLHLLDIRLP